MHLSCQPGKLSSLASAGNKPAQVWVLPMFKEQLALNTLTLPPQAQWLDEQVQGAYTHELKHHAQDKTFTGKVGEQLPLSTFVDTRQDGLALPHRVIWLGLGPQSELSLATVRKAYAGIAKTCQRMKLSDVVLLLPETSPEAPPLHALLRAAAEGVGLGSYRFAKHTQASPLLPADDDAQQEEAKPVTLETVLFLLPPETPETTETTGALQQALLLAQTLTEQTNLARTWVMDSPNHITPSFLAEQARAIAQLAPERVECTVLEAEQIEVLGMGAFHLVAQGSEAPHYLLHLTYTPAKAPEKTVAPKNIALVGKGITFDSGGLSLKPPGAMETMKLDMGGAAAVLATMRALAVLAQAGVEIPIRVDAYVPTCENMPSGRSSKPGDVIRAMNGKTIEVNNTDAEGRLILCDALTYAQRPEQPQPDEIIDLATLTGAVVVALGKVAAGIMGTSEPLIERIRNAGEAAGEKYWPLPLYEEYEAFLKSDVADLINSGSKGEAGSSAGGMFLKHFIDKNRAWVHLDIAGPAYTSKETAEVPKGGSGFGVRTLFYYLLGDLLA